MTYVVMIMDHLLAAKEKEFNDVESALHKKTAQSIEQNKIL